MASNVQPLMAQAQAAQRNGQAAVARGLYEAALRADPSQPQALNALAVMAIDEGRAADATALLERAIRADGNAPELWMNLAKAHRLGDNDAAERAALDAALRLDQRHFMALVRLAELHERRGETGPAMERWTHVLAMSAMFERRTPALDALFAHASAFVAEQRGRFAADIEQALAEVRGEVGGAERRRFDACLDHALGRRVIYANECAGTHFPFLPAVEFFDEALFPWLAELEAETSVIRAELEGMLADGGAGITPYVTMAPGTPVNKWTPLDGKLDWGAMHLWRNGVRQDEACARAPRTAAILDRMPMADMPGRTPTAFFSILKPHTHLPAHTGVSNTRAIVHLPLIVPPGCALRVGGETREWVEGRGFVFDDTIEHEAWNNSDQLRAVLILDAWNPFITEQERGLLRAFYRASDRSGFNPRAQVGD